MTFDEAVEFAEFVSSVVDKPLNTEQARVVAKNWIEAECPHTGVAHKTTIMASGVRDGVLIWALAKLLRAGYATREDRKRQELIMETLKDSEVWDELLAEGSRQEAEGISG